MKNVVSKNPEVSQIGFLTHYHPSLTITPHSLSHLIHYPPHSLSPLTHYHPSLAITPHSLSPLTPYHPSLTITPHSLSPLTPYHPHSLSPLTPYHPCLSSPQIKKLVYVYLVRYAEEQQDLALLSISTFQKALKDPNQLIRASALRVLSSIRVPIIAPVMMLSIKESASDMSPYVRKAAAHAIPKLYSLDPEMKESLIEIIEQLLKDKTTVGSPLCVHVY